MRFIPSKRTWEVVVVLGATAIITGKLLAKHPNNAGPADPPIKFPLPPPPPLTPAEEMKTFKLAPGFRLELAAAEPLVEDPIQIAFDEKGRMWVVEIRGYMHGMEGEGEKEPTGRIRILESTRHDGVYDKASIFLDHLLMPRSVLPVRGGALVAEPPNLTFYKEVNGQGAQPVVVATNFGTKGGQPEHMANGLTWGLDNWVYCADYIARFRFMGGKWVAASDKGRSQFGLAQDDYGRLYFNYNSDVLRCDVLPAQYFMRNPNWPGTSGTNVQIMGDQTVWPGHQTPGVNRGYDDVTLRDDGSLRTVTATCGVHVYRGGLFSKEYHGNAFACEPAGNLIKRMLVSESGGTLRAQNAYYGVEFLTSTDERFRPVNMATGPDGALYVVDMYRGVIEHERFLTNYLIKNIEQRKLTEPIHRGRIYRISPKGSKPVAFTFPNSTPALIECLTSANGWVRDTAQRLLVERHDFDNVDPLIHMATTGPNPLARLHALWALDGMNQMQMPIALGALNDADAHVRAAAVRLCEQYLIPATRPQALAGLLKLASDTNPTVRVQLLLTLSAVGDPQADETVAMLLESTKGVRSAVVRDAALSGLRGRELEFLERLLARPSWAEQSAGRTEIVAALARCVFMEHRAQPVQKLLDLAADQPAKVGWRRDAILRGTTEPLVGSLRRAPKMLYLPHKSESLARLLESPEPGVKTLAARVDKTLAWPDKPGVPPSPVIVPLTAAQQVQFDHGKQIYANICAACHQPSGAGQEGLAPPLVDSEWLLGSPQRTARIVLNGVAGPIKVDGVEFQLEMPALATLSDQDIADVLTYARREWEHGADPVDPETVHAIREATKDRVATWTAAELQQIR